MDKAAKRRARRAAAARARRSDPAVRAREAEASRDSEASREDPAVRALTLLTSFIEGTSDKSVSHSTFSADIVLMLVAANRRGRVRRRLEVENKIWRPVSRAVLPD
ncbi:hypothetical protein HPB50_018599 [Hyalomma asiaticum]|uniref:Uncharacterized protein n=1 Tax=Hyalomma asiaticum TaxID=266040 RepID=A0ACB7SJ86_HYAAI|nr:hypothetical protein HPB50_018599 [Hyalomma asiaticum]